MERLTAAVKWAIVPLLLGMGMSLLGLGLYDRFAHEGVAVSWYSPTADMTCMTATTYGKAVMACLPGDRAGIAKEAANHGD